MSQQILAIDDSEDIHDLLDVRLRSEGVLIHHAFDAAEGIKKAVELQPDLILLDVDLPGSSGFDVCIALKADPRTAALQIIFLTGSTDVVSKVRGFELGAVDYVTKPFDAAELRARVRAALRTKRYQDLLSIRAQIDGLTGAYNRAYLDRRLGDEVARTRRYGSSFSLVMADLDHFKRLNDGYGHPFGDRVIQGFAEILLSEVRTTDAVCRYGGEEFALLLPETSAAEAMVLVERIRARMRQLDLRPRGEPVPVTASFGLTDTTASPGDQISSEILLGYADAALYQSKHAGRDCAHIWSPKEPG